MTSPNEGARRLGKSAPVNPAMIFLQLFGIRLLIDYAFGVTTFAAQFGQLNSRHRRLAKKLG